MIYNRTVLFNRMLVLLSVLLFLFLSFIFELKLFGSDLYQDGFYSQVSQILLIESDFSGLDYMHYARFLAIAPFYQIWLLNLPNIFNAIVLTLFLLPILLFKSKTNSFSVGQLLIIFLPFFFSIRISLAACGLTYLYIYFLSSRRNFLLIMFSFFLSLLGSGSVLVFFLILIFNRSKLSHINIIYRFLATSMLLFFLITSLIVKYEGFSNGSEGYSSSGESYSGINSIYGMLLNGTMMVSFKSGNFARGLSYLFLFIIGVIVLILIYKKPGLRARYFGFFLPLLFIFWFEGITFISYQYCLILFISNNIRISSNYEYKITR